MRIEIKIEYGRGLTTVRYGFRNLSNHKYEVYGFLYDSTTNIIYYAIDEYVPKIRMISTNIIYYAIDEYVPKIRMISYRMKWGATIK